MRIAHLTADWKPTGGISSYVRLVVPALAAEGHDVLVVHAGAAELPAEMLPPRVEVFGVPAVLRVEGEGDRAGMDAVLGRLHAFAPDVVHVHASNNFPLEDEVRGRYPTLKTLHSYVFCPAGTKFHAATGTACTFATGAMCLPRQVYLRCTSSKRPGVIWRQYRHAERSNRHHTTYGQLTVTSEFVRQQAMATGFDGDRIAVVPYFTTVPAPMGPPASKDVLYIGRIAPEKGADLMLEALAAIPDTPWRAVVVGEGIGSADLRRRAGELGIEHRVEFAGWLTGAALADVYRRAAVVVVPSRLPEPFSITGIEALAAGRPVVAFGVGGIPEWLSEGVGGFTVPAGDTVAMGRRIHELLADPSGAAEVAARGRARAERDFTSVGHLARLLPLYERVIAAS